MHHNPLEFVFGGQWGGGGVKERFGRVTLTTSCQTHLRSAEGTHGYNMRAIWFNETIAPWTSANNTHGHIWDHHKITLYDTISALRDSPPVILTFFIKMNKTQSVEDHAIWSVPVAAYWLHGILIFVIPEIAIVLKCLNVATGAPYVDMSCKWMKRTLCRMLFPSKKKKKSLCAWNMAVSQPKRQSQQLHITYHFIKLLVSVTLITK